MKGYFVKLTLFFVALFFCVVAKAEWLLVDKTSESERYIDKSNIQRLSNGFLSVLTMINITDKKGNALLQKKIQRAYGLSPLTVAENYQRNLKLGSVINEFVIDCSTGRSAIRRKTSFSLRDGSGSVLNRYFNNNLGLDSLVVIPDSGWVVKKSCHLAGYY